MFWFFGHEACGILALQPGIKPALSALEVWISPGSPVWLQMVELTSLFKLNTISICFCKAGSFMFQGGRCLIQVPSIGSSSGFPDDHVPCGMY